MINALWHNLSSNFQNKIELLELKITFGVQFVFVHIIIKYIDVILSDYVAVYLFQPFNDKIMVETLF